MVKLSCAVITYNEQDQIIGLLKNIYPIFDEIVIVDGISPDKTIKYIEDYKASIEEPEKIKLQLFTQNGPRYTASWRQSTQRNLALDRCTGDWVLALDADERLDGDARVRLLDLTEIDKERAFAFPTYHYWETESQIRVDNWWHPNYHYRFWKNEPKIRYSRHQRHCFPVIRGAPDVRRIKEKTDNLPCVNQIPIHHYHHVPIKKKPTGGYRANTKDVKTLKQLIKDLEVMEVKLRKKGPLEDE